MNIPALLQSAVRLGLPLIVAALGVLIASKAGIILIAMEGSLEMSAFIGIYVCWLTQQPFVGLIAGILASVLYMELFTLVVIKGRGNQVVTGVGFNFVATGMVSVMLSALMNTKNVTEKVPKLPSVTLPGLGTQSVVFFIAIAVTIITWFILYKTNFGLRIRAIGENPATVDSLGVNVHKYQFIAMILVGVLAGIAGCELTLGQMGYYSRSIATTKGYMAFTVVILGGYNPIWIFVWGILTGLIDALQMRAQSFFDLPGQLFLSIPYILTLIVLCFSKRSKGPKHEGEVYIRE